MKKLIYFSGILFALFALGSCSSTIYQATWQNKPVVVDGNPTEWTLPLRYGDSKSGLQYNITNGDSNIYLCIRATEQPIQMKILTSGVEIQLEPSGKNNKTSYIQFPMPGKRGEKPKTEGGRQDMNSNKNQERINMAERFQLEKPEITLSGFLPEYNGTFLVSNSKGIKAAIDWDEQNNMFYELVIPIKSFYAYENGKLKDNPVFGFRIDVKAMASQGSGSHAGGMQEGHSGGGGGHSGGGGGHQGGGSGGGRGMGGGNGGGGEGGMGERQQTPEGQAYNALSSTTSIKFKVRLDGLVKK